MPPAEDDFKRFHDLADELGLTDDDDKDKAKTSFIESAMKRKGYKPVTSWGEPDPPADKKDKGTGDFFSRGGGQYE